MYTLFWFCFLAGIIGTTSQYYGYNEEKNNGRRRRLTETSEIRGPCTYFKFNDTDTCGDTPGLNPLGGKYQASDTGLSEFAHDWMEHTCCKVLNEPLAGVISSVWLWLQVCTKAINTRNSAPVEYDRQDEKYADNYRNTVGALPYSESPLYSMQRYCPQDLEGGELSEWVVSSFFPVMKQKNANFKQNREFLKDCDSVTRTSDAVTVLLTTEPENRGSFGHLAMVVHRDDTLLDLPSGDDNHYYMSFSNYGNTIGAIITGTQATHVGFGRDLENVTKTKTLYNANIDLMLAKWEEIKKSGVMFDLLEKNCAYTVLEILSAGYPECDMNFHQLWTPETAFKRVVEVCYTSHRMHCGYSLELWQIMKITL